MYSKKMCCVMHMSNVYLYTMFKCQLNTWNAKIRIIYLTKEVIKKISYQIVEIHLQQTHTVTNMQHEQYWDINNNEI